jgi:hypothetical protein
VTGAVRVAMPATGVDLRGHFDVLATSGVLDAALDLSVVEFDELAQLAGIAVTGVDTSPASIAVHYTVAWTSFHACDDLTFGGSHARVLRGRAEGDAWVFNRQEPLPIRHDSAEEF